MKAKLIYEQKGLKSFALVFAKEEQVKDAVVEFAQTNHISAAHVTAIGAFSEVILGYFDRQRKTYKEIPIREQVEVLAFAGNIVLKEGRPNLHAHVVVGKSNGTAHGGHFLGGRVWPTLEMIISEAPQQLRRTHDDETGLALINLEA